MAEGPALVVLAAGQAKRYGGVKPLAPVGINGEAVIDLLASDALDAGFATIVLVVGPSTGPAIRYHVKHTWPSSVDVHFALQEVPRGTVHAVLSSADHIEDGAPFGVANADDIYGREGLSLMAQHLSQSRAPNAVVAYRLDHATIGLNPVTRGVCTLGPDATLAAIEERRKVTPQKDGSFSVDDGLNPSQLGGDVLVSTNLWGFGPQMRAILEASMDGDFHASSEAEVLLPEVVGASLCAKPRQIFRVLETKGRCVGVTYPDDLGIVQRFLARQVGDGVRPAQLFSKAT